MPAVKLVTIRDEDNNPIESHFEPSNSFAVSAQKNRELMFRPDGRTVNVNRKLQRRGHYDDKHGFTMSPAVKTETATVASNAVIAPNPPSKEKVK